MTGRGALIVSALALALGWGLPGGAANAADPDVLWKIVSDKCVPDETASGKPAPCRLVDLDGRYAALKDLAGVAQYLLIPTDKITGIESPDLEKQGTPNYFEDAWQSRRFMAESLGRAVPRGEVGLAINSEKGRTQNQLHIHIDCMRADVLAALAANEATVGPTWSILPVKLAGHSYLAMRIEAPDLSEANPFRLLANGVPAAAADMGDQTLVVVGTTFSDGRQGFYLLADHVDLAAGDRGSGEELLDHACALLAQ